MFIFVRSDSLLRDVENNPNKKIRTTHTNTLLLFLRTIRAAVASNWFQCYCHLSVACAWPSALCFVYLFCPFRSHPYKRMRTTTYAPYQICVCIHSTHCVTLTSIRMFTIQRQPLRYFRTWNCQLFLLKKHGRFDW